MESQPQNPEFRNSPENFHPWISCVEAHCMEKLSLLPAFITTDHVSIIMNEVTNTACHTVIHLFI